MRWLLDTNVLSDLVKPAPPTRLIEWMAAQIDADLHIAALTMAEIRRGILVMPAGARRDGLETWFHGPEGPQALFAGRILAFDVRAALEWARLMADGTRQGRPRSALDTVIAAIAIANGLTVVTGNDRHFEGIPFVNPLRLGS